jgi:hypothetical protein
MWIIGGFGLESDIKKMTNNIEAIKNNTDNVVGKSGIWTYCK